MCQTYVMQKCLEDLFLVQKRWREVRRGANCYYRYATSAEVAKKGNFRGFLDFSRKGLAGICSDSLQMLSRPFPFVPRARIGCPISMRVTLKICAVCTHTHAVPPPSVCVGWCRGSAILSQLSALSLVPRDSDL